jgi:hypothetical protein
MRARSIAVLGPEHSAFAVSIATIAALSVPLRGHPGCFWSGTAGGSATGPAISGVKRKNDISAKTSPTCNL